MMFLFFPFSMLLLLYVLDDNIDKQNIFSNRVMFQKRSSLFQFLQNIFREDMFHQSVLNNSLNFSKYISATIHST